MNIDFPFQLDSRGRTATTDDDDHVRDLIEQFLFTSPGERVNRADFGSGLMQMVFAPNSAEIAAALQFSAQSGLQRWLGDVIEIRDLKVQADDSTLLVTLRYLVRRTRTEVTASFTRLL